ncbi:hypothetical protein ACOME3_004902 [Neoechinorhynchus agilis]
MLTLVSFASVFFFFLTSLLTWIAILIQPWTRIPNLNASIGPLNFPSGEKFKEILNGSLVLIEERIISKLMLSSAFLSTSAFLFAVAFIYTTRRAAFALMQFSSTCGQVSLLSELLALGMYVFYVDVEDGIHTSSFHLALSSLTSSLISLFLSQTTIYILATYKKRIFGGGFMDKNCSILQMNLPVHNFQMIYRKSDLYESSGSKQKRYDLKIAHSKEFDVDSLDGNQQKARMWH